jgi:secernin
MCDTWVALQDATLTGQVIFGKNSDRPAFDCQPLVRYPRREWPKGSKIQLEYVEIPQTERTYATLGSSPYWCWGYEEGINEYSVVIGNEAIFTKTFREAREAYRGGNGPVLGLLGMDLIRLALERSQTARQAVEEMGALIAQYGQFGSGVPTRDHDEGGYDNAFLITDPTEAWILEAVGTRWAAKRIAQGYTSISNQPSLRTGWDTGSPDIEAYALQKGWWPDDIAFDFAHAYIDATVPRQVSHIRLMRSRQLLAQRAGEITPQWMMRIARDHYENSFLGGPYFNAADPDFLSICMHVAADGFTWGNTASSCVAALPQSPNGIPAFWWTPGPPCTGCYVPFFVHGHQLPDVVSRAGQNGHKYQVIPPPEVAEDTYPIGRNDATGALKSYWWEFRRLLDTVKGGAVKSLPGHYQAKHPVVRAQFDALEAKFAAELPQVLDYAMATKKATGVSEAAYILDEFTQNCVRKVLTTLEKLLTDELTESCQKNKI